MLGVLVTFRPTHSRSAMRVGELVGWRHERDGSNEHHDEQMACPCSAVTFSVSVVLQSSS